MAKKPRENRVPIMMSDDELQLVDDWRFANRVATRSEAVRRLCQIGVIADASPTMQLAMSVLAHYVKEESIDAFNQLRMKSGLSLNEDVKRLCYAVIEEKSKTVGFKNDDIADAIKSAKELAEEFAKTAKGTHLDPDYTVRDTNPKSPKQK